MKALADYCGTIVEDIATQIMEKAYAKIEPVILELAEKYKLEKDQISLVGVGGGAASLIVYFSNKMGVKYSIPENAEVISSIGVAPVSYTHLPSQKAHSLRVCSTRPRASETETMAPSLSSRMGLMFSTVEMDMRTLPKRPLRRRGRCV